MMDWRLVLKAAYMSDRTSHPRYGTANGDTDPNQLGSRPHPTISHVPILCIANFGVLYRKYDDFSGGRRSRRASLLACISECPFPEAIYELSACEFRGWCWGLVKWLMLDIHPLSLCSIDQSTQSAGMPGAPINVTFQLIPAMFDDV